MKKQHPILPCIESYLEKSGMSSTYFGKKVVGNSELVGRLRKGGGLHFTTEDRIREFLDTNTSKAVGHK